MPEPSRGEIWLVDLGYAAKVRPCLVLSIPAADQDRALATLVPHTTSTADQDLKFRSKFHSYVKELLILACSTLVDDLILKFSTHPLRLPRLFLRGKCFQRSLKPQRSAEFFAERRSAKLVEAIS